MTLKFEKMEAGMYRIASGSSMIGFIKKQSAAKWVMYKCSNLSMLGNPVAVKKTLKEVKVEAENIFTEVQNKETQLNINEDSQELDNLVKEIQSAPSNQDLMKEMLERGNQIEWNVYDQEGEEVAADDFLVDVDDVAFKEFLTEDEVALL